MLPPLPRIPKSVMLPLMGVTAVFAVAVGAFLFWRVLAHYFPALEGPLKSAPQQPVAFSHLRHAGELKIACEFCHRNVTQGSAATVPAVEQCMFCHKVIGVGNVEVEKVRTAFETNTPINWVRVHRVPDHVHFVHEAHIRAQIPCSTCHGEVQTMQRIRQVRPLKMGDCVDCHRANSAPTDCVACHR